MICIHHNKDLDGFSSGAIVKLRYPECKLIGWDYKDPIPWNDISKNDDIIMIDISFPMDDMLKLKDLNKSLTIIDHHISFNKDFEAYENTNKYKITYIYEANKAACEIGWEYFFPNQEVPYAITLLGRYDTWRQKEGDWENETLPFQYYMRIGCTSAETFPIFLLKEEKIPNMLTITQYVNGGNLVLKYQEQQDMLACERSSFEAIVGGFRAICLNTRSFSSNTLKTVYNPEKHDILVGFEYTGTKWSVSLRSIKPEFDVSLIAKSRGGGGHKAAAGFETNTFEEIFKN